MLLRAGLFHAMQFAKHALQYAHAVIRAFKHLLGIRLIVQNPVSEHGGSVLIVFIGVVLALAAAWAAPQIWGAIKEAAA